MRLAFLFKLYFGGNLQIFITGNFSASFLPEPSCSPSAAGTHSGSLTALTLRTAGRTPILALGGGAERNGDGWEREFSTFFSFYRCRNAAQRRKEMHARILQQCGSAGISRDAGLGTAAGTLNSLRGGHQPLERLPMSPCTLLPSAPFLTFFYPFCTTSSSPPSHSQSLRICPSSSSSLTEPPALLHIIVYLPQPCWCWPQYSGSQNTSRPLGWVR